MIVALFCFILFGLFEAVMDKLQFHYKRSIFKNYQSTWWDPKNSWKNKWKNGDKEQGERFLFSSTIFVFVTDAWHFFKFLRNICMHSGIFFLALEFCNVWWAVGYALLTYVLRNIFFEKTFSWVLNSKN
jgi:hypothetical protein